jgi:hypothetical protein
MDYPNSPISVDGILPPILALMAHLHSTVINKSHKMTENELRGLFMRAGASFPVDCYQ